MPIMTDIYIYIYNLSHERFSFRKFSLFPQKRILLHCKMVKEHSWMFREISEMNLYSSQSWNVIWKLFFCCLLKKNSLSVLRNTESFSHSGDLIRHGIESMCNFMFYAIPHPSATQEILLSWKGTFLEITSSESIFPAFMQGWRIVGIRK